MGSFLEFLYTGEYFPRKVPGQRVLEHDPTAPGLDDTGDHLLRHARIYTLADKFGMDLLKKLASSKIHCINSTAKGELAYARYVYAHTPTDETTVRAPIASFWAARSHALRAEAEVEFKNLCLEHPQFGYDVLSKFCLHHFLLLSSLLCPSLRGPCRASIAPEKLFRPRPGNTGIPKHRNPFQRDLPC